MLTQLSIRDVVLIDLLELEFGPGLGVLTGETGAGKSILLDALGLALGMRADSALVRAGQAQAVVSEITFKNGRAQQDNFHQYEIVRMNMAPKKIFVHFIPSDSYDAPLGGVGEPAVPVIAPALMNAIHGATGKRIRSLPLRDQLSSPV